MRNLLTIPILLFCCFCTHAQIATVRYNPEQVYLNDQAALPTETNWQLTGPLTQGTQLVELAIYDAKADRRKKAEPLYRTQFQQPVGYSLQSFSLPVNYLLRANQEYDLDLRFFVPLSSKEREQLLDRLLERTLSFLQLQTTSQQRGLKLETSNKALRRELDALLEQELQYFRSTGATIRRLSESKLLQEHLAYLERVNTRTDSLARAQQTRLFGAPANDLVNTLRQEMNQLLGPNVFRQLDARYFDDYPTERKRGLLSLQAGYAGIYLDESFNDNFYYDGAPFAGFSFPLGNASFAPRLLSNAALSFGLFLTELDDEAGQAVDGPLISLPVYGSIDYKLFDFLRLTVGMTLLEGNEYDSDGAIISTQRIFLRPFVGLSARIDLGIRLGR